MRCRRDLWTKALDLAKHAVDSKSTIPTLAQVVVEAAGGRCIVRGNNLTRNMLIQFPCEGDLGFQTFDLRALVQISKASKKTRGEEIEVTQTNRGLQLQIAGRTFEIPTVGAGRVRVKDREGTGKAVIRSWDAQHFYRGLDYVLPAVSRDATRFHLCGVAMVDNKLITTDGHRLHMVDNIECFGEDVIVDGGTAVALKDAIRATEADFVRARYWDNMTLEFSIEGPKLDALIISKPIESTFPPYRAILPKSKTFYKLDSGPFRESLETARKVLKANGVDVGTKGIEMHANGDLRLVTDVGFCEVLELSQTADPEHHVGANPTYLIDALRGANGTCQIEYGDPLDPIGIRTGEDFYAVVMPQRI